MSDRGRLWANRDFLCLWAAHSISRLGDRLYLIALPWLVLDLTGSPVKTAIAMTMDFLPQLLFGFLAGAIVDRCNRRWLMIICDVSRALILGATVVCGRAGFLTIGHIYAAGFLLSTLTTLFDPTQSAMVPSIVDQPRLVEANSKLQLSNTVTRVIGPALAGVTIAATGAMSAIFIDAITFVVSAVFVARLSPNVSRPASRESSRLLADVAAGLKYLAGERIVLTIAILLCFVNLGIGPVLAQRAFFAREVIGLDSRATGLIYSVGGVGALLGSVGAGPLGRAVGKLTTLIGGLLLLGLSVIAMAFSQGFGTLALAELGIVSATVAVNIHAVSIIQQRVPGELLGRVLSSSNVLSQMVLPAAMSASGVLAVNLGIRNVLGSGGAIIVIACLIALAGTLGRAAASGDRAHDQVARAGDRR